MQPWIHDDSMSNSTSASLPLTTVERSPQRERRASQGSSLEQGLQPLEQGLQSPLIGDA